MAQGGGWGTGKIVLAILGGLALLGVVCCGVGYALMPSGLTQFMTGTVVFAKNVQGRLGQGYVGAVQPDDEDGSMVIVIAVPPEDELTPERISELQDIAWELYVEAYAKGGMPVTRVGVGVVKQSGGMGGAFVGWRKNQITVEELIERTGLAAPPESEFFEEIRKKQAEKQREREEQREEEELTPEEE